MTYITGLLNPLLFFLFSIRISYCCFSSYIDDDTNWRTFILGDSKMIHWLQSLYVIPIFLMVVRIETFSTIFIRDLRSTDSSGPLCRYRIDDCFSRSICFTCRGFGCCFSMNSKKSNYLLGNNAVDRVSNPVD